jgi:hypothetical protein
MYCVLVLIPKAFVSPTFYMHTLAQGHSFLHGPCRRVLAVAMSSPEPMPSPEHGTTTTTAMTVAQSALGDQDDGEEAARICQLVRQVGEIKQAKQALMFFDNKESPAVGSQQVKGSRNRLGHEKANKLVGLFHNLRLMAKMNKTKYVESAVGWNDDDLKSGITKFGIVNHS